MSLVTLSYPDGAVDLREKTPEALAANLPPIDHGTQHGLDAREFHAASRRSKIIGHVVLGFLAIFTVFPILWMYLESFRPPNDLFSSGLISTSVSGANYRTAVDSIALGTLFWHTVFIAVAIALGQLLTSLLAAYSLARFHFRFRGLIFLLIVASWLVPFQVTMLPNYVLLYHFGLLNSLGGIIVPQLASAFGVLLLRQHLNGFPTELLEAARVEGQSAFATLWKVVIPNLGPALSALGILLFVTAWNEYFWPLLVYREPNSVLQLGIQTFLNSEAINYGALMAAAGLATLPIFALYAVLQRRVVNAFVRSGLR